MPASPSSSADATRDRVLQLLRSTAGTIAEVARLVGLTANGVRAHLAILERDGLVRRAGVRRRGSRGKPAQLYVATERAEAALSRAYPPALTALAETLADELPPRELLAVFGRAGKRIANSRAAAPSVPASSRDTAQALLESLGAAVTLRTVGGETVLEGAACPLAAAVSRCPATCEMVRSLLAQGARARVVTRCVHGPSPRCRFAIT
jgi:predicted ArsR family transcriptional regulator